jgi:hypothetical protein
LGATSEQSDYSRRIEALADEVSVQALHSARIAQRETAAQTSIQGMLEQLGFVDLRENLRDSLTGNVAGNPERFDAPDHPRATALTQPHLGSRTGNCGPLIVQRPLTTQSFDGVVYVLVIEFAPHQPLPELRLGKLAAREEREAGDVGPLGAVGHLLSSETGDLWCAAARLRGGGHLVT